MVSVIFVPFLGWGVLAAARSVCLLALDDLGRHEGRGVQGPGAKFLPASLRAVAKLREPCARSEAEAVALAQRAAGTIESQKANGYRLSPEAQGISSVVSHSPWRISHLCGGWWRIRHYFFD
jgi:hypothetical protein